MFDASFAFSMKRLILASVDRQTPMTAKGSGWGSRGTSFKRGPQKAGKAIWSYGDAAADFDGSDQTGDAVVFLGDAGRFFVGPGQAHEPAQKFGIIFLGITDDSLLTICARPICFCRARGWRGLTAMDKRDST